MTPNSRHCPAARATTPTLVRIDAVSQAVALVGATQPRRHHQRVDRADAEHHQRVAKKAVAEAALETLRVVLVDGQRRHVALAAAIEISRGSMMHGVVEAPVLERLPDQQRGEPPDPAVLLLRRHERAMTAVVKDDEGAQHEAAGGDHDQTQRPPRDIAVEDVQQGGEAEIGNDGSRQIERAAADTRPRIGRKHFVPVGCLAHRWAVSLSSRGRQAGARRKC